MYFVLVTCHALFQFTETLTLESLRMSPKIPCLGIGCLLNSDRGKIPESRPSAKALCLRES